MATSYHRSLGMGMKILGIVVVLSMLFSNGPAARGVRAAQPFRTHGSEKNAQTIVRPQFERPQAHSAPAASPLTLTIPSVTMQCVSAICSDGTTTSTILVESNTQSVKYPQPLLNFVFQIFCDTNIDPNCYKKDVYYHIEATLTWSSSYVRTDTLFKSVADTSLETSTKKATGDVSIPCGTGKSGSCKLETTGMIPADLIPNYLGTHKFTIGVATSSNVVEWRTRSMKVTAAFDSNLGKIIPIPVVPCPNPCGGGKVTYGMAQANVADPVNTNNGIFTFPVDDLSVSTSAGALNFSHKYISSNAGMASSLGYGWTHNQTIRLIFSGDPSGLPGLVLFQDSSGNQYRFWDSGEDYYVPYTGVLATLVKNAGAPTTYTLVDSTQNAYTFDATGKLTSLANPQGNAFTYSYDGSGRLSQISADAGTRYFDFTYDGTTGFLSQVSDQTDRSVQFGYDPVTLDLDSYTDVNDQVWTYAYDSNHLMTEVIDPNSHTQVRNEYYTSVPASALNFNNYTIQDLGGPWPTTFYVEDSGATLHLVGGMIKYISLPYTITPNTILEFDYKSTAIGLDQGIGFTNGTSVGNYQLFRIYGTSSGGSQIDDYKNYATYAPAWRHYRISLWNYEQGPYAKLFFDNKASAGQTPVEYFSNVRLYEQDPRDGRVLKQYDGEGNLTAQLDYSLNSSLSHQEAELATVQNATVSTSTYASNGSYVTGISSAGAYVEWTVSAAKSGDYHFQIGFAANNDGAQQTLSIDGTTVATVAYLNTGCWLNSCAASGQYLTAHMEAGTHTVRLTYLANQVELDYLEVSLYDGQTLTTTITDALGHSSTNFYSPQGTLLDSTDATGATTTKDYSGTYRPETIIDANGNGTSLTWSSEGANLTDVEDAKGNPTHIDYNSANQPATVQGPGIDPTTGLPYTTTYEYEAGNATLLQHTEDTLGGDTYYTYTSAGQIETITDPNEMVTKYEYDAGGHGLKTKSIQNYNPSHGENEAGLYNLTTTYTYDDLDRPETTTDPSGFVSKNAYDNAGRLTETIANFNDYPTHPQNYESGGVIYNVITDYYYDVRGNQIAVIDTNGVVNRTYYDLADRVVASVQNLTAQSYTLNTPPDRSTTTATENLRTDTVYDDAGRAIGTVDPKGVKTRTWYDAAGRPTLVVQNLTGQEIVATTPPAYNSSYPDQNVCTQTYYDESGNVIATIDPKGVVTRTYYDALNRPITVVQNLTSQDWSVKTPDTVTCATSGDANLCTDTYYDEAGRTIATTDPLGHVTRTYYDAAGRAVTSVQNLSGQSISVETPPARGAGNSDQNLRTDTAYDAAGRRTSSIDPRGLETDYVYNSQGQIVSQTVDPTGFNLITSYTYDALGRTLTTTDPHGRVTQTAYDDLGRIASTTRNVLEGQDPNYENQYNITTAYTYDASGAQIGVTDPLGHVTRTYYDALGRALSVVRNLSGQSIGTTTPPSRGSETNLRTDSVYDGDGHLMSTTNEAENTTSYEYDGLGRQVSVTDPMSHTSQTTYDVNGNQIESQDAEGVVTRFGYDDLGRLTDMWENYLQGVAADAHTNVHTVYTYDLAGNRLSLVDGNGHETDYTYDAAGRLNTEADALDHIWTTAYDKGGNKTSVVDANGNEIGYSYDTLGRLTGIDYPAPQADVSFTYDELSRRTGMSDGAGSTTWIYNELDRPTSITDPFSAVVGYGYDAVGNRTSLTYPDSSVVNYAYDSAYRLETVIQGEITLASYTYYPTGQIHTVSRANGVESAYTYNDAGWLTGLTHKLGEAILSSFGYSYDEVGNRTQAVETFSGEPSSTTIDYTYDPLYRLTGADYDTPAGMAYTYSYDAVGNRLSAETCPGGDPNVCVTTTYAYDDANRIASVNSASYTWDDNGNLLNDGTNTYTYDAANHLETVSFGGDEISYTYNGLGDRLQQTVNAATTTYVNDLAASLTQVLSDGTNTYLYGNGRIAQESASVMGYFLGDALGSVRQLTNDSGVVSLTQSFDPYGNVISTEGTSSSIYGYDAEQKDNDGLIFLRARYYASYLNQFIQPDTIVPDPHIPADWNKYTYTRDDPINYTDPNGHYYDRVRAALYAMKWQARGGPIDPAFDFTAHLDPVRDAEFINGVKNDQCTIFASSALYTGGIRDSRGDPYKHGETNDYSDPSYWDIGVLMDVNWSMAKYSGLSWMNTPQFYDFTTLAQVGKSVVQYSNPPQRFQYGLRGGSDIHNAAEMGSRMIDWYRTLNEHKNEIQKGDLVFYGKSSEPSSFFHVAMVIGWGSPTYFDKYPDIQLPANIAQYFSCQPDYIFQPVVPEVVERSGAVDYTTYRSLDNTSQPIPYLEIVHING